MMQRTVTMPKIISSSEAKSRLGELLKWVTEMRDTVIVTRYGEPAAVIMSHTEYQAVEKLRKREQKRKVLDALNALHHEVHRHNPDLSTEEAYRLAGFSEEVIQDTLKADQELVALKP